MRKRHGGDYSFKEYSRRRIIAMLAELADAQSMRAIDVIRFPDLLKTVDLSPQQVTTALAHAADGVNRRAVAALIEKYGANRPVTAADLPADLIEQLALNKKRKREQRDGIPKDAPPSRKLLFGHAVTAVIRWMGVDGWNFKEAREALDSLGFEVISGVTINIQLKAGIKGERGAPAELNSHDARALRLAR
jgi:hypothetical protein